MQLRVRVPRHQLPAVGMAVPDLGVVRRERGRGRLETVPRGVLLEASMARHVEAAGRRGHAAGLRVRRRVRGEWRLQRDLPQRIPGAPIRVREQALSGRAAICAAIPVAFSRRRAVAKSEPVATLVLVRFSRTGVAGSVLYLLIGAVWVIAASPTW